VAQRAHEEYENLAAIRDRIEVVRTDLLDQGALRAALEEAQPHEVYNLASPSFVPQSWDAPVATAEFAAVGVTSLLEAVRAVAPEARVYQASSSEIFGAPSESPQTESTKLHPVTPYGVAKAYGHLIVGSYRARYGLHLCSGILYNHESPRRPESFLPRKVAVGVARIVNGLQDELVVGDLSARRDWGYAGDYVNAMWLALQHDEPGDYVVASGRSHSVEQLIECAFEHAGLDWREHVRVDPALVRGKAELHDLVGDASRAHEVLGWEPEVSFDELVRLLVDADLARVRSGLAELA
jgi:GDPmannose 4,6-dehydratase